MDPSRTPQITGFDEEDTDKERKKRKRKRDDPEDEMVHMMDEVASEKTLQCQVSLAEINRKLNGVMYQPVFIERVP